MRIAPPVTINQSQRETLQQWARSRSLPARQIERAKLVLLAAEGKTDLEIAARLNISNQKAARRALDRTQPGLPLEKALRNGGSRIRAQRDGHTIRRS